MGGGGRQEKGAKNRGGGLWPSRNYVQLLTYSILLTSHNILKGLIQ